MRLVLRTEGNHSQGMGDVWGSIAVAQAFRPHADLLFLLSGGDEALAAIRGAGFAAQVAPSLEEEIDRLNRFRPDVIVINKLNNDPAHVAALKGSGAFIVTIDDAGPGGALADLRINPLYSTANAVEGFEYVTLRDEFRAVHHRARHLRDQVQELLVMQGGSDTYGFLPRIVWALGESAVQPQCTVILGPAFQHHSELDEAVLASPLHWRVLRTPTQISELMWQADLAVTAGGLMMFELACVGTPSVVICAERFEVETAARFESAGAVCHLGFGGELDYRALPATINSLVESVDTRRLMSRRGRELVDGCGPERIAALIEQRVLAREHARV